MNTSRDPRYFKKANHERIETLKSLKEDVDFDQLSEDEKREYTRLVIGLMGVGKLRKFIEVMQLKEVKLTSEEKGKLAEALELLKEKDLLALLKEAFLLYTDANGEPNRKFVEEFDESGHLKCLRVGTSVFSREKSALLILLLLLIELSHERWLDMSKFSMLINEKTKLSTKKIVELMRNKAGLELASGVVGGVSMTLVTAVALGILNQMNPPNAANPQIAANNAANAQAWGQSAGQFFPAIPRYMASLKDAEVHQEQSDKELLRFLQEKLSGFKNELERGKEQTFQLTERVISDKKSLMQTIAGRIVV